MKVFKISAYILSFVLLLYLHLLPAPYQETTLDNISKNISSYRDKDITLRLRLKNIDYTFEKISFYDNKNNDVVFDFSMLKKNRQFKEDMRNVHRGMEYLVSFVVKDIGSSGEVIGDLKTFTPFILNKLPLGK